MIGAAGFRRLAAASAILLLAATLQMASPFAADPAEASTATPSVVDGNPTCADFVTHATMLKIENDSELRSADSGTYSVDGLTVTVDIYSTEMGWAFDWIAGTAIDVVVAKGGPMANVYRYDGATGDSGLHAPLNTSSEAWYGLSHISFCTGDASTTTTQGSTTTSEGSSTTGTSTTTTTEGSTSTSEGSTTTGTSTTTTEGSTTTTRRSATTTAPLGAIGDYVWLDIDKDGGQGLPEIEEPVEGATVQLLASDGTVLASQVTGADGLYLFDDLPAGNYRVEVIYRGATYTIARAPGISIASNSDVDPLGNGVGRTGLINLSPGEVDLTWDAGLIVEVLGVQIESTMPVEPVTLDTLPFTGSDQGGILLLGSALALAGVVTLLISGQRPVQNRSDEVLGSWSDR